MAGKDWTAQVAAAAGVAAGTGAAQLGLGYGLGVVTWPVSPTPDDSIWLGSLGWSTWIAGSATVFGAMIAARLRSGPAVRPAGPWRFALAASAAVGALLTVALIALPARSAVRSDTFSPQTIAAGYALIGILLGVVIAYWAVVSRPVAANLVATAAWLWTLAATAIAVDLVVHRASATYLSSWQFAELGDQAAYGTISWPSALLTWLTAFVIGVIAVWPAVRRGDFGLGAASSGAVGPLLVAAAFLVLAPQLTGALGQLESAYLIAPYAVLAGMAGSASTVSLARQAARHKAEAANQTATGRAAVPGQRSFSLPRVRRPKPATAGWDRGRARSADYSPLDGAPPLEASDAGAARSPEDDTTGRQPATGPLTKWWRKLGGAAHPSAAEPSPTVDGDNAPAKVRRPRAGAHAVGPAVTDAGGPVKAPARSSVKAPPVSPPIAKINPARTGDTAEQAQRAESAGSREADAARGTTPTAERDETDPHRHPD
jgi:hypothetical protein